MSSPRYPRLALTPLDHPAVELGDTMRTAQDITLDLDDGGTVFVCAYIGVDGLAGDLADGETFAMPDGCTVTRRGEEAIWTTPPKSEVAATAA